MIAGQSLIAILAAAFSPAAAEIQPPCALPQRNIAPDRQVLQRIESHKTILREGDIEFTLFAPDGFKGSEPRVTIHFHTVSWFILQEHVRRGATHPLACLNLGEGSSVYQRAFADTHRLSRVLTLIETEVQRRASNSQYAIRELELSSFSAGYGAVREILRSPKYLEKISTIVLADSMYGSLASSDTTRTPLPEHIEVWAPFARAAMEGKKTFLITYSEVPTTSYASSAECASALLKTLGISERGQLVPGTNEFALINRVDIGGLHVWGYSGTNAQAHLTHVRHLAELWKTLEFKNN